MKAAAAKASPKGGTVSTMTDELVVSFDQIPETLTAQDRCDACAARAQHIAILLSGKPLFFCGHHTAKHMDRIVETGGHIVTPFQ